MNKVVNVDLTGGLIGLFFEAPAYKLANVIARHNAEGWYVVQVIPSKSGNIMLYVMRILLLILTLLLYTTSNGYYIIFRKEIAPEGYPPGGQGTLPHCPACGENVLPSDSFCEHCGTKLG